MIENVKDLRKASYEIDLHLDSYQRAMSFFKGTDINKGLFDYLDRFGEEFKGNLNFCATPVEAVSDKLQLLAIKGPSDVVNQQIIDLMDANKMTLRFNQFIKETLAYGDGYICVWPEDSDENDEDLPFGEGGAEIPLNHKAKMTFCSPETTRAFYDDGGELKFVARKWEEKDEDDDKIVYVRTNLYYKDRIEKYIWLKKDGPKQAEHFFDENQEEWPMENPYGVIPIFHFSTATPYGTPEHFKLYDVQEAINRIFRTHVESVELLGFPVTYMLLDEQSAQGTADLEYSPVDNIDGNEFSDVNSLKLSPGHMMALRATSVGQLKPAGSNDFIQSLKLYKEMAADLSQLPIGLFMSTDGQHPSASAQNAANATLNQRVGDRAGGFSETLKLLTSFALKLAFGIEVLAKEISIQWRPTKVEVDAAMIPVLEFKLKLGVSEEQILTELGYTAAEIAIMQPSIDRKRSIAEQAAEAGLLNAARALETAPGAKTNSPKTDTNDKKDADKKDETSSK